MPADHARARKINLSLAAFPGMRHIEAAMIGINEARHARMSEPALGAVCTEHVQIVPQCLGKFGEEECDTLKTAFPGSQFRLHGNVRILDRHRLADLSNVDANLDWFDRAALLSRRLNAPAYSAHAGRRENATLQDVLENARRLQDKFCCPVAVEGNYPTPTDQLLISSWEEYRILFESGVPYALDLSHLNILATKHPACLSFVREMIACERAIEIHVSDNDGRADSHEICVHPRWWHELLPHANRNAVTFTEGNHRRARRNRAERQETNRVQ